MSDEALAKRFNMTSQMMTNLGEDFGLSSKMIVALKSGVFKEENFKGVKVYSKEKIERLRGINTQWSEMGTNIHKAFGALVNIYAPAVLSFLRTFESTIIALINSLKVFAYMAKLLPGGSVGAFAKGQLMQLNTGSNALVSGAGSNIQSIINQTFNGGADPSRVKEAAKDGVQDAFDKIPTRLKDK